jgi:AraC-like DNA-binding protein
MAFGLNEAEPLRGMHYRWARPEQSRHDMHHGLEFGIVLRGRMRRQYRHWQCELRAGQVWMCGMWEPHGYEVRKAPCEAVVLILLPQVLLRAADLAGGRVNWLASFTAEPVRRPRAASKPEPMLRLGRAIRDILQAGSDRQATWLGVLLLEALLLLRENWSPPTGQEHESADVFGRISPALELVYRHRRRVSTAEAARRCGINRNLFGRLFRQTMGLPFAEFDRRYRLSQARIELQETDKPIKTIARDWGFVDSSHFHRSFVEHYAITPSTVQRFINS